MPILPKQHQSNDKVAATPRRNIFEDPAILEAGKNDPFVRFISRNWRLLLSALIAVGLSMIGYNRFVSTALQKRADATKILRDVQDGYRTLIDKQNYIAQLKDQQATASDEKERAATAEKVKISTDEINHLRDKLGLMIGGLDSPQPFDMLAIFYRGMIAARLADFDTTLASLSAINWEQVGKVGSAERLAVELMVLGLSKALLDSEKYLDRAKSSLTSLAERGEFSAARAVDALAIFVSTAEEKERLGALIKSVQQRSPSQQKILAEASERAAL